MDKVLEKMVEVIAEAFGTDPRSFDQSKALTVAKAIGLVVGVPGRNGGHEVTDKGFELLGFSVEQVAAERMKGELANLARKQEAELAKLVQRQAELSAAIAARSPATGSAVTMPPTSDSQIVSPARS